MRRFVGGRSCRHLVSRFSHVRDARVRRDERVAHAMERAFQDPCQVSSRKSLKVEALYFSGTLSQLSRAQLRQWQAFMRRRMHSLLHLFSTLPFSLQTPSQSRTPSTNWLDRCACSFHTIS